MAPEEAEGMLHALSIPQTEENYLRTLLTLVFNADVLSEAQREKICRNIINPTPRRRGRRPLTKRHMEIMRLLEPGMLRLPGGEWSGLPRLEAIKLIAERWSLGPDPNDGSARVAYDDAMTEIREARSPKYDADGKGLPYFDMGGAFHPGGYAQTSGPSPTGRGGKK